MIKSELVKRVAEQKPDLYPRDVEKIINAMLDEIVAALARRDRVELRGFGAFSVRDRRARTGRNLRTGAHVTVEPKSIPYFKTSKDMREKRAGMAKWDKFVRAMLAKKRPLKLVA